MRLIFFTIAFLFCDCKRDNKPKADVPSISIDHLLQKKAKYCELGAAHGDSKAWTISSCDSLEYAALWGTACGEIPIEGFMSVTEPGKWFRTTAQDCFVDGKDNGSDSTISRDMFRGLYHYFLQHEKIDLVRDTIGYGEDHNWIMGEAKDTETLVSKCLLSPGMINELYNTETYLEPQFGGKLDDEKQEEFSIENTGFRAHLDVLGIVYRGRLHGAITDSELKTLEHQAARQPENAVYQFALYLYKPTHDLGLALQILQSEQYFPSDRLPTTADRCVDYLFSHDKNDPDWLPCPEKNETLPGVDLVWAISILDGTLEKKAR